MTASFESDSQSVSNRSTGTASAEAKASLRYMHVDTHCRSSRNAFLLAASGKKRETARTNGIHTVPRMRCVMPITVATRPITDGGAASDSRRIPASSPSAVQIWLQTTAIGEMNWPLLTSLYTGDIEGLRKSDARAPRAELASVVREQRIACYPMVWMLG